MTQALYAHMNNKKIKIKKPKKTKQVFNYLSHTSSPFRSGYFENGVSQIICPGWFPTRILPISASQVARIFKKIISVSIKPVSLTHCLAENVKNPLSEHCPMCQSSGL
jgi:hypothetical protein